MRNLLANACSPIGIDVGARTIKAVQVARRGNGWWVESAAMVPRLRPGEAIGDEEIRRLSDVFYRRGFRGRAIVLAVAPQNLLTSMLELPPRGTDVPLEQIARMELARVHQRDAESFEFAQWEVPAPARGARATHVMAVACPHDSATGLLDAFESQNFDVRALDTQLCAAARACAHITSGHAAQMSAVLDLGWSGSRLAIVHGNVVVYSRGLDGAGFETLSKTLQDRMEVSAEVAQQILDEGGLSIAQDDNQSAPEESWPEARPHLIEHVDALLKELEVSFSYASHQYPDVPLRTLLLIGGGAAIPGLSGHVADRLSLDVRVVNPSELIDCNAEPVCRSPAIVTAIGLARHNETEES